MKTIKEKVINEIIINKSRFITILMRINNEEDVKDILSDIKSTYKKATHYCYAYVIDDIKRQNDDGEPTGTAGSPIMEILNKNELTNILCVVVRYFGGIKLGAGGLIRAYAKSCREALKISQLVELIKAKQVKIKTSYENLKELDFILKNEEILNKIFADNIIYNVNIENSKYEIIKKRLEGLNNLDIEEIKNESYLENNKNSN